MAVFRVEKTKDFTVMSNHHLRNVSLSLKAKGLLSLMGDQPRVELFARQKTPGWDVWGNEVDCTITLPAGKEEI